MKLKRVEGLRVGGLEGRRVGGGVYRIVVSDLTCNFHELLGFGTRHFSLKPYA